MSRGFRTQTPTAHTHEYSCQELCFRTHSRRIGRSLGVDLVPFKTCTYDCIYCQLGTTTNRTLERKEWVPMDAVLDELKRKLEALMAKKQIETSRHEGEVFYRATCHPEP